MKKYRYFFAAASVFLVSGCAGNRDQAYTVVERVAEEPAEIPGTEKFLARAEAETETVAKQWDDAVGKGAIVDEPKEIDLEYIPEMGYDDNIGIGGPKKMGDNNVVCIKKNYVCWKDWLVIDTEVYKRQEDGRYKWLGEGYLDEMLGFRQDYSCRIKQYKNYIVAYCWEPYSDAYFCVYDLDTGEKAELPTWKGYWIYGEFDAWGWYVFDGKIYYRPSTYTSIRTIDLSNGADEEFYKLEEGRNQDYVIYDFCIQEDGTVIISLMDDGVDPDSPSAEKRYILGVGYNAPRHIEYWRIEAGENEMNETKIGETDDYTQLNVQTNKYGLLLDFAYPTDDNPYVSCLSLFYLREGGGAIKIHLEHDPKDVYWTEDGCYYDFDSTEDGYDYENTEYPNIEGGNGEHWHHINAVSKYDLEGNKLKTYCFMERPKLYEGYQFLDLIVYKGKATAFYSSTDENYLYISQIPVE